MLHGKAFSPKLFMLMELVAHYCGKIVAREFISKARLLNINHPWAMFAVREISI